MQYALLIYEDETVWSRMSPEEAGEVMAGYQRFGEEVGDRGRGGEALHPTATATTVRVRDGDADMLRRGAALLRLAEQLERARDQAVHAAVLTVSNGQADLRLGADDDPNSPDGSLALACWMAERQTELFERAFGVGLKLSQS